ncbi:M17 family metallopeptidase [Mycoplasma phocoenae]|uniref:Probable cytosol aminopeptidase n=1 Tax=Mycoplasma phocoenae TaxID=754517 RepID=A0A858U5N9_9MOLU|nr:M17 family metallopeptidase [Mycoplasma phocoenae]QJG66747.1 leucyl aminopeptidase family protein [Mycoplasma phocoenae]
MLKIYSNKKSKLPLVKAVFKNSDFPEFVSIKKGAWTEDKKNNIIYVYNDEIESFVQLRKIVDSIINKQDKDMSVDVLSFVNENIEIKDVLRAFYTRHSFLKDELYNIKTKKDKEEFVLELFLEDDSYKAFANEMMLLAQNVTMARSLQITPPNVCTSEWLADFVAKDLKGIENLEITVLDKKQITELNMGLLLSVNKGSVFEPRVVILNYTPNKDRKERLALVGKGITFDTGGVNTKGYYMEGMKFDMSGSAIVAYALKNIALNKINYNVSAIMMITDNRTNGDPSLPENVYTSMSGKTVEVVDTDAEGRLVLADGITYAKDKLKADVIVDVATLTGTMVRALGTVYSGIYSTCDKEWNKFETASKIAKEKVWRMPFHSDFHKTNTESKVADLNNYSNNEISDCNTAAMFLKEFAEDTTYIHCDVAGTADRDLNPQGELIATITEFARLKEVKNEK